MKAYMQAYRHTDIKIYRHTGHTDIHAYRHRGIQTCRHADIQA